MQYTSRVTFQPHSYYGGPPSNKTDEIWKRLSPREYTIFFQLEKQNHNWPNGLLAGDGIVELPIAAAKNLPESLPAPNNPETALVYGVSVFHQLHCLVWISKFRLFHNWSHSTSTWKFLTPPSELLTICLLPFICERYGWRRSRLPSGSLPWLHPTSSHVPCRSYFRANERSGN